MKVIIVEKAFKHSNDGNLVEEYSKGKQLVSDRCAEVAVEELKVAKLTKDDPEKFLENQSQEESE